MFDCINCGEIQCTCTPLKLPEGSQLVPALILEVIEDHINNFGYSMMDADIGAGSLGDNLFVLTKPTERPLLVRLEYIDPKYLPPSKHLQFNDGSCPVLPFERKRKNEDQEPPKNIS